MVSAIWNMILSETSARLYSDFSCSFPCISPRFLTIWRLTESGIAPSFLRQAAERLLEAPATCDLLGDDFTICAQDGGGSGITVDASG